MTKHKIPTVDAVTLGRQCKCIYANTVSYLYLVCTCSNRTRSAVLPSLAQEARTSLSTRKRVKRGQSEHENSYWKTQIRPFCCVFLFHSLDMNLLNDSDYICDPKWRWIILINTTFLLHIFISFARYGPVEWFWSRFNEHGYKLC